MFLLSHLQEIAPTQKSPGKPGAPTATGTIGEWEDIGLRCALGLDVGTTSLKGLVIDEHGQVLATASRDYPLSRPHPGWSQQDPEAWWQAAVAVCRELTAQNPAISAIGLSGQMHGSVLLDETGAVLTPAILWNDQRSAAECDDIVRLTGGRIVDWTLNPPRTAFTATKILWVRKHLPEVYAQVAALLLPKDYIRFRLSGARVIDVTDASGTNVLDVRARRWSRDALSALDIPEHWLPDVVESPDESGRVTAEAAAATGLAAGTPIVGGGADQAAAAIGNGVTRPGVLSITLGTSGVVYAQLEKPMLDPSGAFHTFCHAVPGTWQMMAGVLSAGGSFQWYRDVVGAIDAEAAERQGGDGFAAIAAGIEEVPAGADGLVFLPYLTGERSPHNDPEARGAWIGLTSRHDRRHLARAVIEGVCYALRDLVDLIDRLGVPIAEVRVSGGGAKGGTWLSVLADVLGRPVMATHTPDASAYGAAALAMSGALDRSLPDTAGQWVRTDPPIEPRPDRTAIYEDSYQVFRALYPATRDAMHRLAAVERSALASGG